ncbi:hypothetical protein I4U23_023649 [Adineta vaga]|nr:hypothetical protein I4U23_023649 [Adineta vaga]
MIPLVLIIIIISILISSLFFIILFIHSRDNLKLSSSSTTYEKQKIRYSIPPTMNIITRRLSSYRSSLSNESDLDITKSNQIRSHSLATNLFVARCTGRRRSSIIDPKQMAQIQFSLPPTAEKFRRRSVAICHNLLDGKHSTIDSIIKTIISSQQVHPCLISFSISYLNSSQIKIQFHSLTCLPSTIQQLTIKVKLNPDGKVKDLTMKNILPNENVFAKENQEYSIQFSHISPTKVDDKTLSMKIHGKDQAKKQIYIGQIGKIHFNEIGNIKNENQIHFTHEIENIKTSSVQILVSLEQNNDHNLIVDILRVKGLKIDQKKTTATCFFRVILLDRHRPLATQETKSHRLNSSFFSFQNPLNFNILAFNCNNLDRLMIIINLYSNANPKNEYQCIGRVKLASSYICSGNGTIHWQQFKERQAFSMWHTLIKQ